eukprot:1143328-Pelagomonas_calceolata.AAC.11
MHVQVCALKVDTKHASCAEPVRGARKAGVLTALFYAQIVWHGLAVPSLPFCASPDLASVRRNNGDLADLSPLVMPQNLLAGVTHVPQDQVGGAFALGMAFQPGCNAMSCYDGPLPQGFTQRLSLQKQCEAVKLCAYLRLRAGPPWSPLGAGTPPVAAQSLGCQHTHCMPVRS